MFILPTNLRFAEAGTRPELRTAFEALAAVVTPFCIDVEVVTETFWAAIHGLTELERSGRIRPGMCGERTALVVRAIVVSGRSSPAALVVPSNDRASLLVGRPLDNADALPTYRPPRQQRQAA